MNHVVQSVELYMARLPLVRPFTTSSHTKDHIEHILLRVRDQEGAEGWGECASPSDPYYCAETSETSWHILRDFLIPGLFNQPFTTAEARQALGTTRRVAIPLLEYLDRSGITQRLPDDRRRLRLSAPWSTRARCGSARGSPRRAGRPGSRRSSARSDRSPPARPR